MRPKNLLMAAFGCFLALQAMPAVAGILATDPNALAGFEGTQFFSNTIASLTLTSNVDYAVYAPGQFTKTFGAGSDPSLGLDYVYAYEVFNNAGGGGNREVDFFSVGLGNSTGAANDENLPILYGNYGVFASNASFTPVTPPYTSATWTYTTPIALGQIGQIELFTSPLPPSSFLSSLQGGGVIAKAFLPSPAPEPSTAMIMVAAGSLALRGRKGGRKARE
jgi:hypothetical protein